MHVRYRGRHLRPSPKRRGPAVVGTAAAVWLAGSTAHAHSRHTVRAGETLWSIASRYGTTVTALARANSLADPNLIVAGQSLVISGSSGGEVTSSTHTVRAGETLSGIASRYGTSVTALARVNHIGDPNLIVAGDTLRITGESAGGTVITTSSSESGDVGSSLSYYASLHGVDASLVKAVAYNESGWQQGARSPVGAIGVMQVMPGTARYVNNVLGGGSLNVRATDGNIELGVILLRHLLDTQPTEDHALAAYLSGPGNVGRRLAPYQRTYVKNVQGLRSRF